MTEYEFNENMISELEEVRKKNSEEMRAVVDKYIKQLYPYTDWHMETVFPRICEEFMREYQPLLDKAGKIYSVEKFIYQFEKEIDY